MTGRTLRFPGDGGWLELALDELLLAPPEGAGDLRVIAAARCGTFGGSAPAWIDRPSWNAFLHDLESLERTRSGSACVESMSPGELRVEIAASGPTGHLTLRGHLAETPWTGLDRALRFGFAIDAGMLPQLLHDARAFAPYPPK
jgi:hypothetical protein